MVLSINGEYYIRDLGCVHNSRLKVDLGVKIQLQQDSVIDIGKIVHY